MEVPNERDAATEAEPANEAPTVASPMLAMVGAINAAVAPGATPEQKAAGVHACRTILAALEAQAGQPIALRGAPSPHPLAGISPDQGLDLLIARLRALLPAEPDPAASRPAPADRPGLRIPLISAPPRNAIRAQVRGRRRTP